MATPKKNSALSKALGATPETVETVAPESTLTPETVETPTPETVETPTPAPVVGVETKTAFKVKELVQVKATGEKFYIKSIDENGRFGRVINNRDPLKFYLAEELQSFTYPIKTID